ncbi:MAG TPA: NAD-dependent epimerase/dehydratase family protein, partial [Caulobacteraceae bacterium]
RILARPGAEFAFPAEIVTGRLADENALAHLAEGAALVVHAAGLIKARRPADFLPVNLHGARRMAAAAARQAPDARFVLVSSLSAREPQLSAYAASKAAGESEVRAILASDRLTIVRPPAIYGPGDRETLALFKAIASLPALPSPGPAHARLALIHVADAAAAIATLAERPAAGGVFALADGQPEGYGWLQIVQTAAGALGRAAPPILPTPALAILALGAAGSLLGRIGPARIMTLGKAREVLHGDWSVRPEELAPGLAPPRFDLAAGFADSVAWYRASGWL